MSVPKDSRIISINQDSHDFGCMLEFRSDEVIVSAHGGGDQVQIHINCAPGPEIIIEIDSAVTIARLIRVLNHAITSEV